MMDATLDFVRAFGWLAAIGVNLLICWIAWSLRHKFVTREDCKQECAGHARARERMFDLLTGHETAMRELALKLQAMPDHERLHSIELKLTRIEGEQGRLAEALHGMHGILKRVENQTTLLMRERMGE